MKPYVYSFIEIRYHDGSSENFWPGLSFCSDGESLVLFDPRSHYAELRRPMNQVAEIGLCERLAA